MQFPEPPYFDQEVRKKGLRFLERAPNPTSAEWRNNAYWQKVLPDMRTFYHSICNYCATWIPYSTGQHSVDHFLDKDNHPNQAYECNNYRYVSARFNSRKGTRTILDPIRLPSQAFALNFTNFFVEVNPSLTHIGLEDLANDTIRILKFNEDDNLINERMEYFTYYKNGEITFNYLQRSAPFIAHELNRQGLI